MLNFIKREQLKNKIQFILDDMTNKGNQAWISKRIYEIDRDKFCEIIVSEMEKFLKEEK